VHGAPDDVKLLFAILGAIGVAIAMLVIWLGPNQRLARRLRRAATHTIAEFPDTTLGRIIGRAGVETEQLVAPLTGRPCLYYVATVLEQQGKAMRTVIEERRGVPFVVDDGTGRAIVDPTPSETRLLLDVDARSTSGTFDDPTEAERAFLARHDQRGTRGRFNRGLCYREAVVEIGETVAVLGVGEREPDPDAPPGDYRSQPSRLRVRGTPAAPVVISDERGLTRRP
jgi:hypothetical protein